MLPATDVHDHHGSPTIHVNGRPIDGLQYRNSLLDFAWHDMPMETPGVQHKLTVGVPVHFDRTDPMTQSEQQQHRLLGGCGLHVHMIPTVVGHKRARWDGDGWIGPGEYCYDTMDACLTRILDADPQAWLMPMAFLGTPKWWARQHPEDLMRCRDTTGATYPYVVEGIEGEHIGDYASSRWREDLGQALEHYLQHIQSMPYASRVIGFHIASAGPSNEWFLEPGDTPVSFSAAHVQAFRRWLLNRYGGLDQIAAAWGRRLTSPDQISVPDLDERNRTDFPGFRHPVRQRQVIDYTTFYADQIAECILHFARIVKQRTQGRSLVAVFHGYINELAERRIHDMGMHAMQRVLECDDVDLLTAPPGYYFRKPGGYPYYMHLAESVRLHGKLWLAQNDYRTLCDPRTRVTQGKGWTATESENINQIRYVFCNDLIRSCPTQFHDQSYRRYDHPACRAAIQQCVRIFRKAMGTDRAKADEIAVLKDPASNFFFGRLNPSTKWLHYQQLYPLGCLGAPFAMYTLADLALVPPMRMYLFTDLVDVDDHTAHQIVQRLDNDQAGGLFLHAAGLVRGNDITPANIARLTGFEVACDDVNPLGKVTFTSGETMTFDAGVPAGPRFFVPPQKGIEALAHYHDGRIAMAVSQANGAWRAYCATPAAPSGTLRQLAKRAGGHIYCQGDETVFANRSFVAVMSRQGGDVTVRLPGEHDVFEVFDEQSIAHNASQFTASFEQNQVRLFFLGNQRTWSKL